MINFIPINFWHFSWRQTVAIWFFVFCLVLKQIFIKNAVFVRRHFSSVFNQGYYIEVSSKTFSSHLTLTRFLIFLQPPKYLFWFFFCLIKKVGLTTRNHATYPKSQSNICLKLLVLESIKKKQNKYLGRAWIWIFWRLREIWRKIF